MQMNVIALPADLADDFEELCRRNHGPLPLVYRSKPGEVSAPPLAEDSDVRRVSGDDGFYVFDPFTGKKKVFSLQSIPCTYQHFT